ncbi:hypothetical protein Btru_072482 [Bulinus truncatus]|nr:hypothetical protein Btru_072482 [Bulinus truncatus]
MIAMFPCTQNRDRSEVYLSQDDDLNFELIDDGYMNYVFRLQSSDKCQSCLVKVFLNYVKVIQCKLISVVAAVQCKLISVVTAVQCKLISVVAAVQCKLISIVTAVQCKLISIVAAVQCKLISVVAAVQCTLISVVAAVQCKLISVVTAVQCKLISVVTAVQCKLISVVTAVQCKLISVVTAVQCKLISVVTAVQCKLISVVTAVQCKLISVVTAVQCTLISIVTAVQCTLISVVTAVQCKLISVVTAVQCTLISVVTAVQCTLISVVTAVQCPHVPVESTRCQREYDACNQLRSLLPNSTPEPYYCDIENDIVCLEDLVDYRLWGDVLLKSCDLHIGAKIADMLVTLHGSTHKDNMSEGQFEQLRVKFRPQPQHVAFICDSHLVRPFQSSHRDNKTCDESVRAKMDEIIQDDVVTKATGLAKEWTSVESGNCCIHGDLHVKSLMLSNNGEDMKVVESSFTLGLK